MKLCNKCDAWKEESNFSWRNKAKGTRASWCKACYKVYDHDRQAGKTYINRKYELVRERREKVREFIWSVLEKNSCIDCGNNNPIVLQFDHRDNVEKLYNISEMYDYSIALIEKEIAKCDVRCANCHLIRTANYFNFWKVDRARV
jgi:hypothetical protein